MTAIVSCVVNLNDMPFGVEASPTPLGFPAEFVLGALRACHQFRILTRRLVRASPLQGNGERLIGSLRVSLLFELVRVGINSDVGTLCSLNRRRSMPRNMWTASSIPVACFYQNSSCIDPAGGSRCKRFLQQQARSSEYQLRAAVAYRQYTGAISKRLTSLFCGLTRPSNPVHAHSFVLHPSE